MFFLGNHLNHCQYWISNKLEKNLRLPFTTHIKGNKHIFI